MLGQSMVGVPKRIISFYIHWTPHLNMLKLKCHIHIESLILFIDRYITKVLFYAYNVKFEQV
jgi:hypothetical protein